MFCYNGTDIRQQRNGEDFSGAFFAETAPGHPEAWPYEIAHVERGT